MNPTQEDAPVGDGSLAGSQTRLVIPQSSRGGSNSRALKIAGLTTLACALLASQIFTALMVFDQNKQIEDLHRKSVRLGKDFTRSSKAVAPSRMQMPLRSLPMVMDFAVDGETKKVEAPKPPTPEPVVSVEEQLRGFIQDFEPPHFNKTFMDNLEALKSQFTQEQWKSFESWMRYWLVFKMAQHKPAPPTESPTSATLTKCQQEAAPGQGRIGSFKPQCDEHGNYKPRQCWHATGFCWCVDKTGKAIEGTAIRGLPQCDGDRTYSRMMPGPSLINVKREN